MTLPFLGEEQLRLISTYIKTKDDLKTHYLHPIFDFEEYFLGSINQIQILVVTGGLKAF